MNENKTPRPVCETESGSGEQAFMEEVFFPDGQFTKNIAVYQVAELLERGEENAISARDLVRRAGCSSTRELRRRISDERERGALILSLPTVGYFLPAEGEKGRREARAFIATMAARAKHSFRMTSSARSFLAKGGLDDDSD